MDIKQALKRSRETWFGKAMHLFDRPAVGDEVWDELEELLIAADVGVALRRSLLKKLSSR